MGFIRLAFTAISYLPGIMLRNLKKSGADIKNALLDLDDEKLSCDDLTKIEKVLPTPDEVRAVWYSHSTSKITLILFRLSGLKNLKI